MKPVIVSCHVQRPRGEVFAFLDQQSNHVAFNDHFMRDWSFSGPPAGPGARVNARVVSGGRSDPVEIEVIQTREPELIVERNVGAGGRRVATGSYRLAALDVGRTAVEFEFAWERAPLSERLLGPVVRRVMHGLLTMSMTRLAQTLDASSG